MKLSTRNSIIKSTVVEIVSPRLLEAKIIGDEFVHSNLAVSAAAFQSFGEDQEELQPSGLQAIKVQAQAEARAEAERIIAEARQKAEKMIAEAQRECENYRSDYLERLKSEIYTEAHSEGYAKGMEEAAREAESIRKQAKAYLEMAKTALADEYHKADREIIDLCLKICDRILHTAINIDPEKLLHLIRNLTLMPQEKEGIKIHMNGRDWEWYKTISAEDKPPYPVVVDESLNPGDIFLECDEGIFDAGIESQLKRISDYVAEELQHARLDGFGEKSGNI